MDRGDDVPVGSGVGGGGGAAEIVEGRAGERLAAFLVTRNLGPSRAWPAVAPRATIERVDQFQLRPQPWQAGTDLPGAGPLVDPPFAALGPGELEVLDGVGDVGVTGSPDRRPDYGTRSQVRYSTEPVREVS
ncbi:MAG: hypothetical protein ACRDOO_07520 [Actinomadura sp.]